MVALSSGRTAIIKSYRVSEKQLESLVSVGSHHKFSLGKYSNSTAEPPKAAQAESAL